MEPVKKAKPLCHECAVHECPDCNALCLCLEVSTNGGDECEHCGLGPVSA